MSQITVSVPEQRSRLKTALSWLAGASTLLYVFSRLVPCVPPDAGRYAEMDLSWVQFLHQAFLEHWQSGRDLVFTFGPWGFLYSGYHPGTHLISVIAWTGLALVFWWTGWKVARYLTENLLGSWFWLVAFTGVAGMTLFCPNIDACLDGFVVLLLLLYFFVEDSSLTTAQIALVVSLALLVLVKASLLVLATAVLGLIATDVVWRRRRFPWLLPVFGGSVLVFWIGAGQKLSSLLPFLNNSRRITGGYTEAMNVTRATELPDVISFLLAATLPCALAGYTGWTRRRFSGLLPMAGLALVLFTAFKYGYVRHDGHEVASALELLLVSLAVMAISWPVWRQKNRTIALATLLQTVVILFFASIPFGRYSKDSLAASFIQSLRPRKVFAPALLIAAPGRVQENYEQYVAASQSSQPFPVAQGNLDVYPWNDRIELPQGVHYRPRPIPQSYSAYTPALADLNAAYLRSERAPEYVLWRPMTIDNHFPTLDDGPSWLELLTRYDIQEVELPFSVLHRSENPRLWKLTPLADQPIRRGEVVTLPSGDQGPIWAQIDLNTTLVGAVVSAFYKPALLWLNVAFRDGRQEHYRLVPGMARSGFLLSPVISSSLGFAALASGERQYLTNREATLLMVASGTKQGFTGYRSPMRLRLFRLEFPAQPLSSAESFRRIASLYDTVLGSELLRAARLPEMVYWPGIGSILAVPADSAIRFPVPGKCQRLKLGFGIPTPESAGLQSTNEIEFRVGVAGEGGKIVPLWSQRLAPANRESNPGTQHAVVDLGAHSGSKVVLEILPGDPQQNAALSCYWSEIQFE